MDILLLQNILAHMTLACLLFSILYSIASAAIFLGVYTTPQQGCSVLCVCARREGFPQPRRTPHSLLILIQFSLLICFVF